MIDLEKYFFDQLPDPINNDFGMGHLAKIVVEFDLNCSEPVSLSNPLFQAVEKKYPLNLSSPWAGLKVELIIKDEVNTISVDSYPPQIRFDPRRDMSFKDHLFQQSEGSKERVFAIRSEIPAIRYLDVKPSVNFGSVILDRVEITKSTGILNSSHLACNSLVIEGIDMGMEISKIDLRGTFLSTKIGKVKCSEILIDLVRSSQSSSKIGCSLSLNDVNCPFTQLFFRVSGKMEIVNSVISEVQVLTDIGVDMESIHIAVCTCRKITIEAVPFDNVIGILGLTKIESLIELNIWPVWRRTGAINRTISPVIIKRISISHMTLDGTFKGRLSFISEIERFFTTNLMIEGSLSFENVLFRHDDFLKMKKPRWKIIRHIVQKSIAHPDENVETGLVMAFSSVKNLSFTNCTLSRTFNCLHA